LELFSPQIPLQLEPRRMGRLDDFVAGPNTTTLAAVHALAVEPDASLYLYGPPGSGKSHLLQAACLAAREAGLSAFYLGLRQLPRDATRALQGLEGVNLVCLDDVQYVAGHPQWEEALFHFINRHRAHRGSLLVAGSERLSALPLGLPDLASRLAWGLRMELQALDDGQKIDVMRRHAESLGVELPTEVADYLLRHGQRGLAQLLGTVERLQHVAFTEKRRITVPLARQVLQPDGVAG
jgi:DnaA family protein